MSTRIQNVRFNYTNSLFTAQKPQTGEGKEKFSVVAILAKDHPQLADIKIAEKFLGSFAKADPEVVKVLKAFQTKAREKKK